MEKGVIPGKNKSVEPEIITNPEAKQGIFDLSTAKNLIIAGTRLGFIIFIGIPVILIGKPLTHLWVSIGTSSKEDREDLNEQYTFLAENEEFGQDDYIINHFSLLF